jgi:K+-sensing histidine kinase KdpD
MKSPKSFNAFIVVTRVVQSLDLELGLSLAKAFAESLEGSISVKSVLHKGSILPSICPNQR